MSTTPIKGRGVRVEVSKTEGTAKVVSAVTKAKPGVATSTAHGLTAGAVGYFKGVEGMAQLEGQAVRVANPTTNTFDLEGLNTTNFPAFTDQADFVPVTAWATLSQSTSYSIGGGESEKLDTTTLIDVIKQEENGLLPAQTVSINVLALGSDNEALGLIRDAALNGQSLVFRITLQDEDGSQRVFRGEPSIPGEDVQKGQVGTGSISVTVKGQVLFLA